jgi:hypothetical protein
MLTLPNVPYLRTLDPRLFETIQKLHDNILLVAQQTGVAGNPLPAPPSIASVTVTGGNGDASVAISDPAGQQQPNLGLHYFVEYDVVPSFANPTVVDIGPARGSLVRVGTGHFYFRAYSSFRHSPLSAKIPFGAPTLVDTTGASSPTPPGGGSGAGGGGGGFGGKQRFSTK